jgi:hypothetical protein
MKCRRIETHTYTHKTEKIWGADIIADGSLFFPTHYRQCCIVVSHRGIVVSWYCGETISSHTVVWISESTVVFDHETK